MTKIPSDPIAPAQQDNTPDGKVAQQRESTTMQPPTPNYSVNMPGVKNFAGRLNSMGYDGNAILQKFNEAAESGNADVVAEKAAKLNALATKVGYTGDLWGNGPIKSASAAPAKSDLSEASTLGELGKAAWNGLLDTVTGIARTPQILHDAAGSLNTAVFGEQDAGAKADSERINKVFKGLGDAVAQFVDKGKADLDATGAFDQGLFSKDDTGDWHYNSLQGAAHSIGQSLGFVASMIGPGLVSKGARAIGVGTSALRAAKAAGDVERVAELTRSAQGTERAMRFVGGVTSQVEPLYQDALEATGDSHKAAAFTAAVAPVVAAIDAFTGVESLAAGGAGRQLSKELVKQVIGRMSGEVTEETIKPLVKTFAEQWVKGRLKEGVTQFAVEGGTEGVQEGYQMLIEKLFDRAAGNTKLADQGGAADARLINSIALGGLVGGPMGAILHHNGTYHPTAFKVLQDAYLDGGRDGLNGAVASLQRGLDTWGGADVEQQTALRNQVDRMASVISSFKNPYQVDPKTQFQYYDVAYNQLPDQQNQLAQLQAQHAALTSDQPTVTDIDEDGQPVVTPVDPIVAANLASQLAPELADQERRVKYLSDVQGRLTSQGKYQDWAKGYDVIGKYQPGDRVVGSNLDDRSDVDGTVTGISEDGQTLTVEVPPVQSGDQPTTVSVRALDARPFEQSIPRTVDQNPDVAEAEVGAVSVGDNLADGFISHQRDETGNHRPYATGQRVVLADDPTVSYAIETGTDSDGNQTLTIAHPNGPITGTLEELTDKTNPRRLLGTYSPEQALSRQDWKLSMRRNEETSNKLKTKLPAATVTALDAMSESQLQTRYEQLGKNKEDSDERKYIALLAERNGWPVTAPEASAASQREFTQDTTAADTPAQTEPVLDAGEEVIDDELFNQIIDSDQIPNEVIADIAARELTGQSLTERQQILFDGFDQTDEAVYMAALDELGTQVITNQISTDEPVQPAQTPSDPDTPGSPGGSAGEVSQDGQGGSPQPGTQTLPRPDGSIPAQLAEAPASEPAHTGSQPVSPAAPPTPGPDQNGRTPVASLDYPTSFDAYGVVTTTGVTISDKPNPNTVVGLVKTATGYLGYVIRRADGGRIDRAYTYRQSMINPSFNDTASPRPAVAQDIQTLTPAEYGSDGKLRKKGEVFYQKDDALYNPAKPAPTPIEEATKADGERIVQQSLTAQQQATQPTASGSQVDGIATVGTQVRVLLTGGTETLGVIQGKNAEGDIIVRRMNRKGTAEENFPHSASSILSLSGKPIAIDPDLPAVTEEVAQAPASVKPGKQMMAPGTSGGQVLVDVLLIGEDGTAKVRVVLSNVERTVPINKLSEPTVAEIKRVGKILSERKGLIRRQVVSQEDVQIPQTPPEVLADWINRLRKAFPRVKAEIITNQQMTERFGEPDRGAVENGVVYINFDTATSDTPLHEYAHIYNSVLKKYSPQLYQRGLQLIEGSSYVDRVRRSHPHLKSEDLIREEALATAIADKGISLPTPTAIQRFKTWTTLIFRRISEAVGFPLTLESTLNDYLAARARELTSGRQLSNATSAELAETYVQSQKANSSTKAALPSVLDETTLGAGTLSDAEREALLIYDIAYDPHTDSYTRQQVDKQIQAATIQQHHAHLSKQGKLVDFVRKHTNILTADNLMRLAFGENSPFYSSWSALQEQQQRAVADVNVATHAFARQAYQALQGRSTYRGATSWEAVEKWEVIGTVNGQARTLSLPVDVVMDVAGQYRTTMTQYGHIDPQWEAKQASGQPETGRFEVPNPDNPRSPITIELTKAELRALEDRIFYQDAGTASVMQSWVQYTTEQLPALNRVYTLINGQPLARTNWYYPLSVAATEEQLNKRTIQQFVDDARLLKSRQGIPDKLRANGMLQTTSRYGYQVANYVQLAPLWHNLDRLLVNQSKTFDANPELHALRDALDKLKTAYQTPDIARNQAKIETSNGSIDLAKLLRLATLSRFAFNVAIPMKQITGFTSALGNGAIRDEFLLGRQGLGYLATIAESYWLVGRGSKEGGYTGGQTSFDETLIELRTISHPDARVLLWRAQGAAHPDIHFDDWGSVSRAGKLNWAWEKMRYFSEEYGLSISQRADSAVVRALYEAAKAQVRSDHPSLAEQEVREQAVPLAKKALYYSNQTFDRTDKAPLQLDGAFLQRIISLYKGQNFKVYNTMALRVLELGDAPDPQRPAVRQRLRKAIAVNVILAPLITLGVDALVSFIRDLPDPTDDDKEQPVEQVVAKYTGEALSLILQAIPGNPFVDFASWLAYKFANPKTERSPLDVNPLSVLADFGQAVGELSTTLVNSYRSEDTMHAAQVKLSQQVLRSGSTLTGFPQEAIRLANHAISLLLPEGKPSVSSRSHRHHRGRSDREINYGIEYLTDTDEEQHRHHRRR